MLSAHTTFAWTLNATPRQMTIPDTCKTPRLLNPSVRARREVVKVIHSYSQNYGKLCDLDSALSIASFARVCCLPVFQGKNELNCTSSQEI
jgi:hypothetical protein